SSVSGVEVGTELVWSYCQKSNKPSIIILNKLDKDNSKYQDILQNMRNTLSTKVFPVQIPVNEGAVFDSIIDIIEMKLIKYTGKTGEYKIEDIPGDLADEAEEMRNELKEIIAESDDDLLEKYLEEGDLTDDEFRNGLTKAITDCNIYPVLFASAELNVGPASILDFIISFCPDPSKVG
ncbi:MAG: elongation factor G, partial [bacterium]|nr:elongation factor G [bacterium]